MIAFSFHLVIEELCKVLCSRSEHHFYNLEMLFFEHIQRSAFQTSNLHDQTMVECICDVLQICFLFGEIHDHTTVISSHLQTVASYLDFHCPVMSMNV